MTSLISTHPVCQPLFNTEEVLQWTGSETDPCIPRFPSGCIPRQHNGRKWLVCHDMSGGYLDDRFVQGVDSADGYRFCHWAQIDTFVYFSHHFVTIPPPAWTTAAAQNGVRVLGTIITEWDDGKKLCAKFLKSNETAEKLASKLVDIACQYRFQGWLVNIENVVEESQMPVLVHFVRVLCQGMRQRDADSQVLWYDSVISSGELKWQNELNELNYQFFDACDGIFLNYTWKDGNLERSVAKGTVTGDVKSRLTDIYVGVDVFGRGCRGGGGFNTVEAIDVIRPHGLSVALFAPGWVYEKHGKEDFMQNNNRFWSLLEDRIKPELFNGECFVTSFCQGWGHQHFINGEVVSRGGWTNLALQNTQSTTNPTSSVSTVAQGSIMKLESFYHTDDAYRGGGALKITGNVERSAEFVLFSSRITLSNSRPVTVHMTYKQDEACGRPWSIQLDARSHLSSSTSPTKRFILLPTDLNEWSTSDNVTRVSQCVQSDLDRLHEGHLIPRMKPQNGWMSRTYVIDEDVNVIERTSLLLGNETVPADADSKHVELLLGEFKLMTCSKLTLDEEDQSSATLSHLTRKQVDQADLTAISCTVAWTYSSNNQTFISFFSIYTFIQGHDKEEGQRGTCLGHTAANQFHVTDICIPSQETNTRLVVVPMLVSGVEAERGLWKLAPEFHMIG